jgi:hypothetical protein
MVKKEIKTHKPADIELGGSSFELQRTRDRAIGNAITELSDKAELARLNNDGMTAQAISAKNQAVIEAEGAIDVNSTIFDFKGESWRVTLGACNNLEKLEKLEGYTGLQSEVVDERIKGVRVFEKVRTRKQKNKDREILLVENGDIDGALKIFHNPAGSYNDRIYRGDDTEQIKDEQSLLNIHDILKSINIESRNKRLEIKEDNNRRKRKYKVAGSVAAIMAVAAGYVQMANPFGIKRHFPWDEEARTEWVVQQAEKAEREAAEAEARAEAEAAETARLAEEQRLAQQAAEEAMETAEEEIREAFDFDIRNYTEDITLISPGETFLVQSISNDDLVDAKIPEYERIGEHNEDAEPLEIFRNEIASDLTQLRTLKEGYRLDDGESRIWEFDQINPESTYVIVSDAGPDAIIIGTINPRTSQIELHIPDGSVKFGEDSPSHNNRLPENIWIQEIPLNSTTGQAPN